MGYTIALAGKGGTGKTTIAALLVRLMIEKNMQGILAIDADPNSNLAEALGLEVKETIGNILDGISAHPDEIPPGTPKDRFIEYRIQQAIQEASGFDVLTMGKPEGPGCYCYVNNVLRNIMGKLIKDYKYIIIDNEAGLEHLSRRTTRCADLLLVISDATVPGLRAAQRIHELARALDIEIKKKFLIINRSDTVGADNEISRTGLQALGAVPRDKQIENISLDQSSLMGLKEDAVSLKALRALGDRLWPSN